MRHVYRKSGGSAPNVPIWNSWLCIREMNDHLRLQVSRQPSSCMSASVLVYPCIHPHVLIHRAMRTKQRSLPNLVRLFTISTAHFQINAFAGSEGGKVVREGQVASMYVNSNKKQASET